jgi:amidohydrolase
MIKETIQKLATAYFEDVRSIRRHMHMYPELSFEEGLTADFIAAELDKIGLDYSRNVGGNGIVVLIEGAKPGPVRALRGDFDALPIQEENTCEYASKNTGVMHACGHDVHTSCVLGAVRIISQLKENLSGTLKVIFQPAEEKLPGGASLMIKDGVLENPKVEAVIGEHVYPDLEVGKVGMRSGMYMASADEIYITIKGKGGHAALPHKLKDPILMMAEVITGLQQVISRNCKPDIPSVLSFGKVIANGATNIIPDEVSIAGTFRTMNEEWRFSAHEFITNQAKLICQSMGGDCDVNIEVGYPYLMNDEDLTSKCYKKAVDYLGKDNVIDLDLRMTSEDFAFFSHHAPACFYRLGTRNTEKGIVHGLHTSRFDVDEEALRIGMGLLAYQFLE